MPIICVVVFGLCWLADYMNGEIHGHHFDGQPDSFWEVLRVILRLIIAAAVSFFFYLCSYISAYAFYGFGG